MDIVCQHISANCNPMPSTLTFLDDSTLAFCFSNQVGLYSITKNAVLFNLNDTRIDSSRANCIQSLSASQLLVGYDGGHFAFYKQLKQGEWECIYLIKQTSSVISIHYNKGIVISCNISGEVIVYQLKGDKLDEVIKLKYPLNKLIESVTSFWNEDQLLIFMAGVDQKVHCYSRKGEGDVVYRFGLKGHENAITKLAVTCQDSDILLASASKDGYIRVWRLTKKMEMRKFHKNVKQIDDMICFLDAVLIAHECSVVDIEWVRIRNKLDLVSCSLDCTICVWGKEEEGAWSVDIRMGQFLGNKNSYFNIEARGNYLVAVNYIGSAIIWKYQNEKFNLLPSFNGHSMEVRGVQWNHTADFIVSVSKDQTTRIMSANKIDGNYHEISRAQIHGYDINAVATIKVNDNVIDLIACGADEKVVRIIEPPACFANYLNYSTRANLHLYFPSPEEEKKYLSTKKQDKDLVEYDTYAEGGLQVLGLMTKMQRVERQKITSYYDDEEEEALEEDMNEDTKGKQSKLDFKVPPHDDYLVKHTLWPEINKLYGHPHQISSLATCHNRYLLVSSCSGLNKTSCKMIVWNTKDWKIHKILQHHSYTVYGMDFSADGEFFASVSKDRRLAVFNHDFEPILSYQAHTRAITCVSFHPSSKFVATGSRDKLIKVHSIENKNSVCEFNMKKPITSLTFCGKSCIAVGLQDGQLSFLRFDGEKLQFLETVSGKFSHTKSILSLNFKNGLLASGGEDHSVRVFRVTEK